jgi:hypothetical protein
MAWSHFSVRRTATTEYYQFWIIGGYRATAQ